VTDYDAFLLVSFGGPEGMADVLPFLQNVTRGRGVPPERLAEVAEHYYHFNGVSPINGQNRELLAALSAEFADLGIGLPIYWGNRNWSPMLVDTVRTMRDDGVRRAVAFVTTPYGSYSSCRQYLDDIASARAAVGDGAPAIDKIRHYHDDPGFIAPFADGVRAGLAKLSSPVETTRLVFTAHSIPVSMAATSGPSGGRYVAQLREAAALVAAAVDPALGWDLVWQSRSGPPQVPWLEPDINDHLKELSGTGVTDVIAVPIGFNSDHLEVLWDLDIEAANTANLLGLRFARAATPGCDPRFVTMVARLVQERLTGEPADRLGRLEVWPTCSGHCCPAPGRPGKAGGPGT
jgi:ferrochelatase